MQEAPARKRAVARVTAAPMSNAERELEAMKAYAKKITSSKKRAVTFLEQAGIVDENGRLAKPYRA